MSKKEWKSTILDKNQTGLFGFITEGNIIFIRSHNSLEAFDFTCKKTIWKVNFRGDNIFGFKTIYACKNNILLVTITNDENEFFIVALNSKNGDIKWKVPIGWSIHFNYGGLFVKDEQIFLIEKKKHVTLKLISLSDGSSQNENEAILIQASGKFQHKNRTAYLVKDFIYAQGEDHVVRFELNDLTNKVYKDFRSNHIYVTHDKLIRVSQNNNVLLISAIDNIEKIIGQVEINMNEEVASLYYFKHSIKEYVVLSFTESTQILIIDIQKVEIDNLINLPAYPIDCIQLEEKLIVLGYTDESNPIITYDIKQKRIERVVDRGIIRGGLYNFSKGYVFTSSQGLELQEIINE